MRLCKRGCRSGNLGFNLSVSMEFILSFYGIIIILVVSMHLVLFLWNSVSIDF